MLEYTVVAGPNGAGKSLFSKILSSSGSLIFDADIIKALKEWEYPDLPAESIEMMVTSAYWTMEDEAIESKCSLTVETNLRDDFLIKRLDFFKNRGYTTNLIYMLLPDVETSFERVGLRVIQNGHFIDADSINYNFTQGQHILKNHFKRFDRVQIIESYFNGQVSNLQVLLKIQDNYIEFINPKIPLWAKPIIDELLQNLIPN